MNPVPKILKKLNMDKFTSFSCQIKNKILSNNENNQNHFEKPNKTAYLFDNK